MEQTAHVFGEFNQADDSIIRKYGGTGLGLSISKKLVEMQEGSLTLRSVPNEGTTFSIVLPMQRVAAPELEQYLSHKHPPMMCWPARPCW
jgi:signal transduction histidine kinase